MDKVHKTITTQQIYLWEDSGQSKIIRGFEISPIYRQILILFKCTYTLLKI
jgi:hypothetical protein